MKYMISQLNREVELNDELYETYIAHDNLMEYPFVVALFAKCETLENIQKLSDEELSSVCNETLFSEIETLSLLPNVIEFATKHREKITQAAKTQTRLKFPLISNEAFYE